MIIAYIMGIPIDDSVYRIPSKKEKDNQLEIDFEKDNKESEIDAELNKMTKKELIEKCKYLQKVNIQIDEERKDITTKFKQFATEANKKADKLIIERNELLNKLSKANDYIDYLKATIENIKLTMRKTFNIIIHV